MNRTNEQHYAPEELFPSDEEISGLREKLVAHYNAMPKFKGDPLEKANSILEACKTGWRNCPKTYAERVRVKSKMGHPGAANLESWGRTKERQAASEKAVEALLDDAMPKKKRSAVEAIIDHIGRDKILKSLSAADKKFWTQREKYYRSEFEFNSSSDFALLIEVISNELKIHKIHEMEFQELETKPDPDRGIQGPDPQRLLAFSKMTAEAHKQLQDSLKALGVTRDQRRDEMDDSDGDLATLSMSLDKKLKAQAALHAAHLEEEEEGLNRKFLRGDVYDIGLPRAIHNRIPNEEEVAEIIAESGIIEEENG